MENRSEAWHDLGGNIPAELTFDQMQAMVNAGLGGPDMKRKVELELERREAENSKQRSTELRQQSDDATEAYKAVTEGDVVAAAIMRAKRERRAREQRLRHKYDPSA